LPGAVSVAPRVLHCPFAPMRGRLIAFVVVTGTGAFACLPSIEFAGNDAGMADATTPDGSPAGDASADADGGTLDATTDGPMSSEAAGLPLERLAAGTSHTCALRSGGTLYCWGDNGSGELGRGPDGPDGSDYHPAPVLSSIDGGPPLTGAVQALTGEEYSCTLVGGTPYCWGNNDNAQLGDNGYDNEPGPSPVLAATSTLPLTGITRVAAGRIAACAEDGGGHWYCWGNNLWGQLSDSLPLGAYKTASLVMSLDGAISVAMGTLHTCAILGDGSVICFGLNDDRQVGQAGAITCTIDQSTAPCEPHPVTVMGLSNVKQLALAEHSTCALQGDGAVLCWGASGAGELGTTDAGAECAVPESDAGLPCTEVPHAIQLGRPAVSISGGEDYGGGSYCALFADGSVSCWGSDTSGQLGIGAQNTDPNPVPVAAVDENGPLTDVVEIASGDTHRCALKGDAAVLCWGSTDPNDPDGRLGTPALTEPYAVPVEW
jgi:alpha-tubulin suppressor-like RCC1 family protein